jgi:homoserine kinase
MAEVVPKVRQVQVRVPATSANLGSGFDVMGLALDYHDELTFTVTDCEDTAARVVIHGEGERTLPRDERHLVVSTFRRACQTFGLKRFGFMLEAWNNIPQARGMGSSAEAIVAGIAAAAAFAQGGNDLDRNTIFELAAALEGHPDNVAPAAFGGLTVSWDSEADERGGSIGVEGGSPLTQGFHAMNYAVDPEIAAAVFIPDFELSTERARQAIPATVSHEDAVFNLSRVALLPAAMNPELMAGVSAAAANDELVKRSNELLFVATQDRLHQRYRADLMPSSASLIDKLRAHGFAAAVSGAGPCVIVLHYGNHDRTVSQIDAVAADELSGGHWRVLHLPVNVQGVQVQAR